MWLRFQLPVNMNDFAGYNEVYGEYFGHEVHTHDSCCASVAGIRTY